MMILDPRAKHHDPYRPDAEFVTLCQDADREGAKVMLDAVKEQIVALRIEQVSGRSLCVPVGPKDTWRTLAEKAREMLEASE